MASAGLWTPGALNVNNGSQSPGTEGQYVIFLYPFVFFSPLARVHQRCGPTAPCPTVHATLLTAFRVGCCTFGFLITIIGAFLLPFARYARLADLEAYRNSDNAIVFKV